MAKSPSFQFYPADWLKDPALQMCSAVTKGIWIDLLCHMWEAHTRGEINGTAQNFCRLLGISEAEWETFLEENALHQFANIVHIKRDRHAIVQIQNRRMIRDEDQREAWRKRKQKERVTLKSHNSPTVSSSSTSKHKKNICVYSDDFEQLWKLYPRRVEKKKAYRVFSTRLKEKTTVEALTLATKNYANHCKNANTETRYIKHPATFWGPDGHWEEWTDKRAEDKCEHDGLPDYVTVSDRDLRHCGCSSCQERLDVRKRMNAPDGVVAGEP